MHRVLQLDIQGTPQAWITLEDAASHYATGAVAWEEGSGPLATLRGGWNVQSGRQSQIVVLPIVALRGMSRRNLFDVPATVTKAKLLVRDRCTCAYCAQIFLERDLQVEHIVPDSRGGPYDWMNLVAACSVCNARKANRTPDEAKMALVYLPYVPNRYEAFLLEGRNVRADVHEWLVARVAKGSRLN